MTMTDQRRAWVLAKFVGGELSVHEVAVFLGLSERSVWRLRARFVAEGPAALVHGNRGRASPRRVDESVRARVVELARTTYAGANDTHLAELLAEREGISLSRVTVRRILRAGGQPSPRKRRAPRHRSRRDRMPQAGPAGPGRRQPARLARGPRAEAHARGRDRRRDRHPDRGHVPRPGGHRGLPRHPARHGPPPRHPGRLVPRSPRHLRDPRAGAAHPGGAAGRHPGADPARTGPRRARDRLDRGPAAPRPRAGSSGPGAPCRTASSSSSGSRGPATGTAPTGCSPATCPASTGGSRSRRPIPAPAWRPLPAGIRLDRVCSLRYRRTVAGDGTVRAGATILQLPARPGGRSRAGQRVELLLRLDGRIVVWDGERDLVTTDGPADPVQLRALEQARGELGTPVPRRRGWDPTPGGGSGPAPPSTNSGGESD